MSDHVILIDGSGFIFRAYHALPPLSRPSDNHPVGAVHGFCKMLWKLLREANDLAPPSHIAVIFDYSSVTFRNEIAADYKANRPPLASDLACQFPLVRDAVRAFNVQCIEKKGYEADDLIATYATQAEREGRFVTIVSSDKDLMQLVTEQVLMYEPMHSKLIGRTQVNERFGVWPELVADALALIGDASDNVAGIPGIGEKTAAALLNQFGNLEGVLQNAEHVPRPKRRQNLIQFAEQARIASRLVVVDRYVPLDVPLSDLAVQPPDTSKLLAFLREQGFVELPTRIEREAA